MPARRPVERNRVAHTRRPDVVTCRERLVVRRLLSRHRVLRRALVAAAASGSLHVAALVVAERRALEQRVRGMLWYTPVPHVPRPANERWMMATVAGAMEQCRGREHLFEQTFGCRSDEALHMLECGFMGGLSFVLDGRGAITPECALLMLLHRYQCTTTTLDAMSEDFGADTAVLSAFLDAAERFVDEAWCPLTAIENIFI